MDFRLQKPLAGFLSIVEERFGAKAAGICRHRYPRRGGSGALEPSPVGGTGSGRKGDRYFAIGPAGDSSRGKGRGRAYEGEGKFSVEERGGPGKGGGCIASHKVEKRVADWPAPDCRWGK